MKAGLVDGVAVYGHWIGPVHSKSYFGKMRSAPFVQHGWIKLPDDRVLDPTRWAFEDKAPYLYVGEAPDSWGVTPCVTCGCIQEEHTEDGPPDHCDNYEVPRWPYDEGGNQWRDLMMIERPKPVAKGPLKKVKLTGFTKTWVGTTLGVEDASKLAANQLMYMANMSYDVIKGSVGRDGLRMIYEVIVDFDDTSVAWIPVDNFERARRECGLQRDY